MTLTASQIVDDVIALLQSSPLAEMLTGEIYHETERPQSSRLEDILVYLTAANARQIQRGVVVLNIFIDDFDARGDGVAVKNGARCKEVEIAAQQWVDSLPEARTNYKWFLESAISTGNEPSIKQHFVAVRLGFDYFGG